MLSLVELQEILGKHVKAIDESGKMKAVERQIELENSMAISSLAKQMIASAKVQLQARQLETELEGVIKKNG